MSFARGCALLLLILATFGGACYLLSLWMVHLYPTTELWWVPFFSAALLLGVGLFTALSWVIIRILGGPYGGPYP